MKEHMFIGFVFCISSLVTLCRDIATMEGDRRAFKILTGKPAGKRPLGRPRRRWEDNSEWTLKR